MTSDPNDRKIILSKPSELSTLVLGQGSIVSRMTEGVIAFAKNKAVSQARYKVGKFELAGADYEAVLSWSRALSIAPDRIMEILARTAAPDPYDPYDEDKIVLRIENGRFVSLRWDFDQLPITSASWCDSLSLEQLKCIGKCTIRDYLVNSKDEPTKGVDQSLMQEVVAAARSYAKTSGRTFQGYVESIIKDFGETYARDTVRYLEAAWGALYNRKLVSDPAGKVSDYITKSTVCVLKPNIKSLRELYVCYAGLEAIELQGVPNLTELICRGNQLTNLDLTPVPLLKILDCQFNRLTNLDLTPLPLLTELNYGGNQLTDIDLTAVPLLTVLTCLYRQLTNLDLTPVPLLRVLNCWDNQLTNLDLSPVPLLTKLVCGGCHLTELDLSPVPLLTELDCLGNQLTELDLSLVPLLTKLDCLSNQLTTLDLTPVPLLTELDCGDNQLMILDLRPVPLLTRLRCADNQFSRIYISPKTMRDILKDVPPDVLIITREIDEA